MRKFVRTNRKLSAFTLVEILVVIAILAILAVATFVILNPAERINQAKDTTRREDVNAILKAVSLFVTDNRGTKPTYGATPAQLPQVTTANILTAGVDASDLNGISPTYMTRIPTDPDGVEYKVGQTGSPGAVLVGILLSDGTTVFTASE